MTINSYSLLSSDYVQPRRRQLFEGTSKTLYDGPEPGTYVLYFKDDIALEDGVSTICGKGVLNNRISDLLMSRLNDIGIDTHFIRLLNMREQLVRATETLPFSVTLHNIASGAFAKRLGLEEQTLLSKPIPEFFLRSKELGNPILAAEHLTALGWSLVSFTLEFGRFYPSELMDCQIILTDELSPDTCNLLDLTTGKPLGRQGIHDNPEQARGIYQEVARRLGILRPETPDLSSTSQDIFPPTKPSARKSLIKKKQSPWL
ncbi:MAG: purC [Alphaproteobacteria bacterium]|nr:purC [Alphaproteobacteria bacterium]